MVSLSLWRRQGLLQVLRTVRGIGYLSHTLCMGQLITVCKVCYTVIRQEWVETVKGRVFKYEECMGCEKRKYQKEESKKSDKV